MLNKTSERQAWKRFMPSVDSALIRSMGSIGTPCEMISSNWIKCSEFQRRKRSKSINKWVKVPKITMISHQAQKKIKRKRKVKQTPQRVSQSWSRARPVVTETLKCSTSRVRTTSSFRLSPQVMITLILEWVEPRSFLTADLTSFNSRPLLYSKLKITLRSSKRLSHPIL